MKEQEEEVNNTEDQAPRIPTQEEFKRMRKQAAMDLAEYKRRLRESVELKRLQTEELELNIKFYHLRQEYKKVEGLMHQEEALERADRQQAEENIKNQEKKMKARVQPVPTGKPRTKEEIEEVKEA